MKAGVKKILVGLPVFLYAAGVILACGGFYQPRAFDQNSIVIQPVPSGMDLLFPENKKIREVHAMYHALSDRKKATFKSDIADLNKAAPTLNIRVRNQYATVRTQMLTNWGYWSFKYSSNKDQLLLAWNDEKLHKALPLEFALYLKGAVKYRSEDREGARKAWLELLDLPEKERKYRSVWAAWMLARTSAVEESPLNWYTKVEKLVDSGFPDSLGLLENKEDWRIYFGYRSGKYMEAMRHYMDQGKRAVLDPVEAGNSVSTVIFRALHDDRDEFMQSVAADSELSAALSLYIENAVRRQARVIHEKVQHGNVANGDYELITSWFDALNGSGRKDLSHEASILATSAYNAGFDDIVLKYLELVKDDSERSLWLRAKIAAKLGKLKDASKHYGRLIQMIDSQSDGGHSVGYSTYLQTGSVQDDRVFTAYLEYGSIELGLGHYSKALDLFILSHSQGDAAYIAESLLSPEELLTYVRNSGVAQDSKWVQELLGRKLARHHYFKDARKYIPEDWLSAFDEYVINYRYAINTTNPQKLRAKAMWEAAQLRYAHQRKLFHLENGCRPWSRVLAADLDYTSYYSSYVPRDGKKIELLPAMKQDEQSRFKKYYRKITRYPISAYDAAELAYRAAMMLPSNDTNAAIILHNAGLWTMYGDPDFADKYYQTLVTRCGKTELGKASDEQRWFLPDRKKRVSW